MEIQCMHEIKNIFSYLYRQTIKEIASQDGIG